MSSTGATFNDYDNVLRDLSNLSQNAVDTLRNRIVEEMNELNLRLQYLAAVNNKLVSIDRLPPEILARIFTLVRVCQDGRLGSRIRLVPNKQRRVLDNKGRVMGNDEQVVVKQMLPVTWVSRHWRAVALGEPTLWNHIDRSNCRWMLWCLVHSKDAPLFVDLSEQAHKMLMPSSRTILFEQFPRIKELKIGGSNALLDTTPEGSICLPDMWQFISHRDLRPHLPSLSRDTSPGTVTLLQTLHLRGKVLHDILHFSNYTMPHLAYVKFQRCTFDWGEFLLPSLRTLWIEDPTPQIRVFDLLRYLSRMPLLQELTLIDVLSEESGSNLGVDLPKIHSPNLTSLSVVNRQPHTLFELVTNLTPPPASFLSIETRIDVSKGDNLETVILPFLPTIQQRFTALDLNAITLSGASFRGASLAFGQETTTDTEGGGVIGGTVITVKESHRRYHTKYYLDGMLRIIRNLPLIDVRRLHLKGPLPLPEGGGYNAFINTLNLMPTLEELIFEGYTAKDFLRYLAGPSVVTLPASLKTVTFGKMYYPCKNGAGNLLDNNQIELLASRREERGFRMILRDPELRDRKEDEIQKGREMLEGVVDEVDHGQRCIDLFRLDEF